MATYYVDGSAGSNGSGTELSPYNAVPSNTFSSSNTWLLKGGSTLALGATQHSIGNNVTIGVYGTGTWTITSTGNALTNSTGSNVTITDGTIQKIGAVELTGLDASSTTNMIVRRVTIDGYSIDIQGRKATGLTVTNCQLTGGTSTYGIRGQAQDAVNCNDWTIESNYFSGGIGIDLNASATNNTVGAFNRLRIVRNQISDTAGSAIIMACPLNANVSSETVAVTNTTTITKSTNWPAWTLGQQIFLAGFTEPENFGLYTVQSVVTTTLTVQEATLVVETGGQNKGIRLRDQARAFINPVIEGNILTGQGETPMLIGTMFGGSVCDNNITDATTTTTLAAGIEMTNAVGVVVERNVVRRMSAPLQSNDGAGIFFDGACSNCIGCGNDISELAGVDADNSGFALGLFFAENCVFHSNVTENCKRGLWVGGTNTTGHLVHGNVFAGHELGIRVNGSPQDASITLKNNLIIGCDVGIDDDAVSTIDYNAWWQNTTTDANGTLQDANAVLTDPMVTADYRPMIGSPLLEAGVHLGYTCDKDRRQRNNPPTIGAYEGPVVREART